MSNYERVRDQIADAICGFACGVLPNPDTCQECGGYDEQNNICRGSRVTASAILSDPNILIRAENQEVPDWAYSEEHEDEFDGMDVAASIGHTIKLMRKEGFVKVEPKPEKGGRKGGISEVPNL